MCRPPCATRAVRPPWRGACVRQRPDRRPETSVRSRAWSPPGEWVGRTWLQYPPGGGDGKNGNGKRRQAVAERVRVAAVGDFPPGSSLVVDVGGTLVAVFHADGQFYAI